MRISDDHRTTPETNRSKTIPIVHLADGRELEVPHRDFVSHSPQGRTFIVWDTEDDACEFVDLLLVTSLELKSTSPKNGNGGSKKRKSRKLKNK